jgi:hypothetical protein
LDRIVHAIRHAIELALTPLDALPPWLSLAIVAIPTALLMLVVVKRVSPQRLVSRARDRIAASIYEMRLFLDEPRLVLRAQARLLGWTVVYLATLIPAIVVMTPPLGLLYLHLEPRHGLAPIAAPSTIVVRIELEPGVDGRAVTVDCRDAIELTAPLLVAPDEPAVYARLAIREAGTHAIVVHAGGRAVEKTIVADPRAAVVAPERAAGVATLWSLGSEPPPDGPVRSIRVPHPERSSGLPVTWWLYWLAAATVIALALRRRFDVVM